MFCAMTLRAINMTTVAHGSPFIHSFMYSYANMPLQLGLAIVLCDITVMLLYAFHKVQVSDERIREKLGVTYVKTTEG